MTDQLRECTDRFYLLLDRLSDRVGGARLLRNSTAAGWPTQGVYFFYEDGETRANGGPRVVRVGTHALTATSRTTLWKRLAQHRGRVGGSRAGGGNHRASIFRHHVGTALLAVGDWPDDLAHSWRDRQADRFARLAEYPLERAVSEYIGAMPLLWLPVFDRGLRASVERNSIALLSSRAGGIDQPTDGWLGRHADSDKIRTSGLWNVNHVDEPYKASYLGLLERLVEAA